MTTQKVGGFDVLSLEGEFLAETEQTDFKQRVRTMVNGGTKHLIVDLQSIRHVNSCGLGSMVCAVVMMRKSGGDVSFVGVNRDVGRILEITHLDKVFRVFPGMNEAIDSGDAPLTSPGP